MVLKDKKYVLSGDISPLDLVERYGSPVYVYETATIDRQFARLSGAFSNVPSLRLNYACKANANLSIIRHMRTLGAGLDCVSIQEVKLGLYAGFEPQHIIFTPSGVSINEYREAVALGVRINIDSISMLEQFGQEFPNVPVCIRINPHIMAGGNHKISVGHIDSKFGISIHQMPHVERVANATGLTIEGIHMHTGSDILDVEVFLQGAEILLNVARRFPNLTYVDFGSGFKVPYKEGDVETDIELLGTELTQRFFDFCAEYGRALTLMFEPGKFLVSASGTFLVKVNVVKTTLSSVFVGVDSGLNHLIRPMFYNSYHHILNITNPDEKTRIYNVVGYICETDTFAVNRIIPEVLEGDVLAFQNAGAYCFSMSSNYNARFRPAEVLIHHGKDYLIRRRETIEDLLRTTVEPNFEA